jgi:alpha/beta superfamily hydrolase
MEEAVTIHCNNVRLEGLLHQGSLERGVVITHPHPLYGGNMNNPVVEQIQQSYSQKDFTTLRFNFRGTGNSSGMFDNGVGEMDDVRAALACLKDLGVGELCLAGYSFGARINALVVASGYEIRDHVMISPPMGFMSFDDVAAMPSTGLILTGAMDDIAPPKIIQAAISRWKISPQFEVIEGGDHFYSGRLPLLKDLLLAYLP